MTSQAKNQRKGESWAFGHVGLMLLALAIVWGSIGLNLQSQHRAATEDAWKDADNLVRAFTETISRIVESVDQTLLHVREDQEKERAGFDLLNWARSHPVSKGSPLPLVLTDSSGKVVQSTTGPTNTAISVADREPFKSQAGGTADALMIGTPGNGRVTGHATIVFSRKLRAPDGSFAGEVAALLDPAELSRFYELISIGNGSITLMNSGRHCAGAGA